MLPELVAGDAGGEIENMPQTSSVEKIGYERCLLPAVNQVRARIGPEVIAHEQVDKTVIIEITPSDVFDGPKVMILTRTENRRESRVLPRVECVDDFGVGVGNPRAERDERRGKSERESTFRKMSHVAPLTVCKLELLVILHGFAGQ